MFVDVVGFSKAAETLTPKEAFDHLRELIDSVTRTVHEFGGKVDRTLGDGMLCLFGLDDGARPGDANHADRAVECAIRIQYEQLARALSRPDGARPIHPLRIGINTTACFIGNLGGDDHDDVTVIGDGVNFAQRLETACDSYRIMLGGATQAALLKFARGSPMMKRKYFTVKHHTEVVEAYELDPFFDKPELLDRALAIYRKHYPTVRKEERIPIRLQPGVKLSTEYGYGDLIDYSIGGFGLRLDKYLSQGVTLTIDLDNLSPRLRHQLLRWGLTSIVGEVRWARPVEHGFRHGIKVRNLSARQCELLFSGLDEWLQPKGFGRH